MIINIIPTADGRLFKPEFAEAVSAKPQAVCFAWATALEAGAIERFSAFDRWSASAEEVAESFAKGFAFREAVVGEIFCSLADALGWPINQRYLSHRRHYLPQAPDNVTDSAGECAGDSAEVEVVNEADAVAAEPAEAYGPVNPLERWRRSSNEERLTRMRRLVSIDREKERARGVHIDSFTLTDCTFRGLTATATLRRTDPMGSANLMYAVYAGERLLVTGVGATMTATNASIVPASFQIQFDPLNLHAEEIPTAILIFVD